MESISSAIGAALIILALIAATEVFRKHMILRYVKAAIFDSCYQKVGNGGRGTFLNCNDKLSASAKWPQRQRLGRQ
jgi:hypothetical protein